MNILDSRLRGRPSIRLFAVIPAQAGIQDTAIASAQAEMNGLLLPTSLTSLRKRLSEYKGIVGLLFFILAEIWDLGHTVTDLLDSRLRGNDGKASE